jgi:hypothetical protein
LAMAMAMAMDDKMRSTLSFHCHVPDVPVEATNLKASQPASTPESPTPTPLHDAH